MYGMRGSEFGQYFQKIPLVNKQFMKVTSIDELPVEIPEKHFIISNLSPSNEIGSHWIALIRSENDTLEIFNSLGMTSLNKIESYLKFKKKKILYLMNSHFKVLNQPAVDFFVFFLLCNNC